MILLIVCIGDLLKWNKINALCKKKFLRHVTDTDIDTEIDTDIDTDTDTPPKSGFGGEKPVWKIV